MTDPLSLVSLDTWDVDRAGLSLSGGLWEDVVPAGPDIDVRADALPREGWREVTVPGRVDGSRLFAAPAGDGWALAFLTAPIDGRRILSGNPGPVRARPGRASRRAGLRLTFPVGVECDATELTGLRVALTNVGPTTWQHDSDDSAYVHGWIVGPDGERGPSGWFTYGGGGTGLRDLAPGESLRLPVDFHGGVQDTPPGTYRLDAQLLSLDLWAELATVVVR